MFMLHNGVEVGFRLHALFNRARKSFQTVESLQFLFAEIHTYPVATAPGTDPFSAIESISKKVHRFVVRFQRYGKRMPIFAAMRERKSRRIVEAGRRAVNNFGN